MMSRSIVSFIFVMLLVRLSFATVFQQYGYDSQLPRCSNTLMSCDVSEEEKVDPIFMHSPVELVKNDQGNVSINQEALKILSAIDMPVVVVAIAGRARTGKSYLLNRLAGIRKGFSLGSTIQSHTKGIWMMCLPHPRKPDHAIILLDTEGFGDPEKGDNDNDSSIFTLSILLSSMFIYNSRSNLDQSEFEYLHFVSELTKHIQLTKSKKNNEEWEFIDFFPDFVWVLRDLTLDMTINEKTVSADEYLEHTLKLKNGTDEKTEKFNTVRRSIRNYFPKRKCFGFVCPTTRSKRKRLDELLDEELDAEFVKEFELFSSYIYEEAKTKTVEGVHKVTGRTFGPLVESYIAELNSTQKFCVESAVTQVAEKANQVALEKSLDFYRKGLENFTSSSRDALTGLQKLLYKTALQIFLKNSFLKDSQEYLVKLMMTTKEYNEETLKKMHETSLERCTVLITDLKKDLINNLKSAKYSKPGGYAEYMTDLQSIIINFTAAAKDEAQAITVLKSFTEEMNVISETIKNTDNILSEKENTINDFIKKHQRKLEAIDKEGQVKEQCKETMRMVREALSEQKELFEERCRYNQETKRAEKEKYYKEGFKKEGEKMREEEEFYHRKTDYWSYLDYAYKFMKILCMRFSKFISYIPGLSYFSFCVPAFDIADLLINLNQGN
ncbi:guanylate-binding protein 1-like isoform X2 [Erpetoichthys calabaricus]|uniref:guanylate-binding protein 1-like isoform X2 n=1 Tax=Erpetoichthys calabaricus TaxID=27687 RepID=UPI0010A061EC|nr:guanylate-binding protein 1-like isoform X2 [Erpetoichthys calabaricus]